jgi:predicted DNA-binding transcriptional regulator AlpA
MSTRLYRATDWAHQCASSTHPVLAIAEILNLHMKYALLKRRRRSSKDSSREKLASATLNYNRTITSIEQITGFSSYQTKSLLAKMQDVNLIEITGIADSKSISFNQKDFLERVNRTAKSMGADITDQLESEAEFIEVANVENMVGVDQKAILRKIANGDFPENVLLFRKSEIMSIINDKGVDYFKKQKLKSVEDFEDIHDIEFVDMDTLQKVFGTMEPYKLAILMKGVDCEIKVKIEHCLSDRRKAIIESAIDTIHYVDQVELLAISEQVIEQIKVIKEEQQGY